MFVVLVLGAVNYFLFFHDAAPAPQDGEVAALMVEAPEATRGALAAGDGPVEGPDTLDDFGQPTGRVVEGELSRGQTVLKALGAEGIDSRSALPLIHAMQKVFDFRKAQVGDAFVANLNDEGQVTRLTYTHSPLDVYEVTLNDDSTYDARKKHVPTRIDIAHIGCSVRSTLYESLTQCGESGDLAGKLIDLFAWDIDFFHDVRKGDSFRVIVEKISVDGRFLKYGKVIAADYKGKFGEHRIVHYKAPDGVAGYYTSDGRGVRKDFIKSPLKYTRVSARGQTGIRTSLKSAAPVIYTAQKKTPVWAVAAGTVVFAGESGSLGNAVTIRHDNGYTSTYGHLGRLARGIEVGSRVKQKTVLGRVGQSGKATAPQLLFSLRKGGRLVNPLKVRFTEGVPVSDAHRADFDRKVRELVEDLEATPITGAPDKRG